MKVNFFCRGGLRREGRAKQQPLQTAVSVGEFQMLDFGDDERATLRGKLTSQSAGGEKVRRNSTCFPNAVTLLAGAQTAVLARRVVDGGGGGWWG